MRAARSCPIRTRSESRNPDETVAKWGFWRWSVRLSR
jgi:hypothetical protein